MSNDYFKAQGWFKNYALNSQDSRGMFQRLVKEDEEAFRLASAETDKIKAMINKKFGSGSMKYGSEIPQPATRNDVIEIDAINSFMKRNPAAEGGRMGFSEGLDVKQIIVPKKFFNKRESGIYTSRNKSTKDYTGQPFVRDSTKNKPLPPNAVRSGESVIFLGENAQANADKFLELTRAKGGDLNELKRLIDEANKGFKFVKIKDLQEAAGFSRQTSFNSKDGIYGSLDTLEIKLQKAFDYVMGDPNKLVVDMFDPMSQVKKLVGTSDAPGRYLKGYEPYESNKKIIKVLAAPKSKAKLRKAEGLTFGDLEFRIDNNVKGDVLFAPPKQISAETKIFDIADRHIKQGGTKIEWTVKPEITPGGNPSYGEARFKYNGKEYGMGELINNAKDDPNFKEFFKAQREYKTINDKIVTHPKTGEKIRFGNLMKEVYGDSVVPYNVDHYKSILDEPFTSLRVLPRRINTAAGNIKSFNEMDITKPELAGKYSDAGKEMQIKKIGYNYNQSIDDLIEAELKLAKDVLVDGRVLRKPNEIIESIRKGENYVPDFYSKDAKPGPGFDKVIPDIEAYITDTTGKVKQPMLSSGFAGAYEMLSDDLKAIVNSDGFKKFAASKTGKSLSMVARAPTKLFGLADVLFGYLDYTNNEPMMSKAKAWESMLQAMSFGIYRGGDKQNLEEIKQKFIANGGNGKIFDQVVELNKSNFKMVNYMENMKKEYQDLTKAGYTNLAKDKMNVGMQNVAKMGNENLDKFEQYKTDLAVSEAGSPIQIKDVMQPSKDVKKAAFDLLEEEQIKNYPTTSKQLRTESGPVANELFNAYFTKDFWKKFLPQNIFFGNFAGPVTDNEKLDALIKNMEPRERYLYNLARGQDPDNPITISETANFMDKNKRAIGFSEGGITTLRSKYEYKK